MHRRCRLARVDSHLICLIQATITQRLSALHSLHTLRAHLQSPRSTAVHPPPTTIDEFPYVEYYFPGSVAALYPTATVLGSTLPQPNITLWLLQRGDCGAIWTLFRPVSKQDVGQSAYMELDTASGSVSVRALLPSFCSLISFPF